MRALRAGSVLLVLLALAALPLGWAALSDAGLAGSVALAVAGFLAALDAVGWVFVPQAVLAVAVLGAALQRIASRLAGIAPPAPDWIDPAIESALLLGMLGTIHGMVNGFSGLSPEQLEPAPLVESLGTALRSSFVGFGIALVGVWTRARPADATEQPA